MIFNLRKCTFGYMECKIRGVKRDKGYINNFLDGIVDHRNSVEVVPGIGLIMYAILKGTFG